MQQNATSQPVCNAADITPSVCRKTEDFGAILEVYGGMGWGTPTRFYFLLPTELEYCDGPRLVYRRGILPVINRG